MKQSYRLKSGLFEITLEKLTRDTGTVSVSEKRPRRKAKVSATKLYGIRATPPPAAGIVCKADVFGRDPTVTITPYAGSIRVRVVGAIIADTDTEYPAAAAEISGLRQFLAACAFPKS